MVDLHINNLSVYYGETLALDQVNIKIRKGDFVGIMGPNGGGKSTLLRAILNLVPNYSGEIHFGGTGKGHPSIGYVPQFVTIDSEFPISVLEVVSMGLKKKGMTPFWKISQKEKEEALCQLEQVGIVHLAQRQIGQLSGGELQRLFIARALVRRPQILLLDEPTASVDNDSKGRIYETLEELNKDMTILLVTHDCGVNTLNMSKLIYLDKKILYNGEPKRIIREQEEEIIVSGYI